MVFAGKAKRKEKVDSRLASRRTDGTPCHHAQNPLIIIVQNVENNQSKLKF